MNPLHTLYPFQLPQRKLGSTLYTFLVSLGIALLILLVLKGTARSAEVTPGPEQTDQVVVVRIRAETQDDLQRLLGLGLDMLETRDGNDLLAIVTRREQATLTADGWDVRVDPQQTALLSQASVQTFQSGYRTVEEIEQFLHTMAEEYPTLTRLVDIGDSWDRQQPGAPVGYHLWALRITNQAITETKPVFFLMAATHARELTTAEIAIRFVDYLLTNYGRDAEATWLLNEHEIVVVPMVNPDGRKLAEQGYLQRKNTNTSYGGNCPTPPRSSSHFGVDLNRNFSFQWGAEKDVSPCSAVFPGGTPASEPETQSLQAFIQSLYPNHPRLGDGVAAPYTTTGVLISLHSYSDLVLWPWGYTYEPAPDATGLEQLGQRLAAFNHYEPTQAIGLYPTSGTTDDWAYGELRIAAYTFEIGPDTGSCAGFMPPYACLDGEEGGSFWPRNLPALLYAARVSRAPYVQPDGPDIAVRSLSLISDTDLLTLTLTLTNTEEPISATEVYVGASPWYSSTQLALQPSTTTPASEQQWQVVTSTSVFTHTCSSREGTCLGTADLVPVLLVRAKDAAGDWGPFRAVWAQSTPALRPPQRMWLPLLVK